MTSIKIIGTWISYGTAVAGITWGASVFIQSREVQLKDNTKEIQALYSQNSEIIKNQETISNILHDISTSMVKMKANDEKLMIGINNQSAVIKDYMRTRGVIDRNILNLYDRLIPIEFGYEKKKPSPLELTASKGQLKEASE